MSASSRPTDGIDWAEVHERLATASAATLRNEDVTPERSRAIMEARARMLARVPAAGQASTETIEVVTFTLGCETYAIEASTVRAILRTTDITAVPGLPDFVMGVTNLRGEVLAVIDLRRFLQIPEVGITDRVRLIVLGLEHAEFGILADTVHEVVTLRADRILQAPASGASGGREHLRGVTEDGLVVLDAAALLADERLTIDQMEDGRA